VHLFYTCGFKICWPNQRFLYPSLPYYIICRSLELPNGKLLVIIILVQWLEYPSMAILVLVLGLFFCTPTNTFMFGCICYFACNATFAIIEGSIKREKE
jgi:hypothetical protein